MFDFAPFSPMFFVFIGLVVVGLIVTAVLFKNKSRDKKCRYLMILSIATFVIWIVYKYFLSKDEFVDFNIWNELPLHLCNLAILIGIFAAGFDKWWLQAVCYFGCTIGAVMALMVPSEGFSPAPFFTARGLGYWGTHFMVLFLGFSFVTLGIYKPRFKDIPVACGELFLLAAVVFVINVILRATVFPEANYCYTYGLEGPAIVEWIFGLIKPPLLKLLPLIPVFGVLDCFLVLLAMPLGGKKKS